MFKLFVATLILTKFFCTHKRFVLANLSFLGCKLFTLPQVFLFNGLWIGCVAVDESEDWLVSE